MVTYWLKEELVLIGGSERRAFLKSLTKKDNNMKKLEDLLEACGIKTMSEDEMLEMLKQTSQWANEDSRKEALIDPLNSFV